METTTSEISRYKSMLAGRLKEAFKHEHKISPIDRKLLLDTYRSLLDHINGFIVICNYTTGLYEYISDGIRSHLGYDVSKFSEEQLTNFVLSTMDEKHREFLLNSFMPVVFNYYNEHASRINPTDYRYAVCMKIRNAKGDYVWYLIDTVVIEADANGTPLRTLITCTNIHQFKKDELVYYNIQSKNEENIYEVLLEGSDNSHHTAYNLTARELQVINLVSQGLTNQEIADKIFVSLNTVKTHRKNIMRKTKCRGTAELTNFAFSRGLL